MERGAVSVVASVPESEAAAKGWLASQWTAEMDRSKAAERMLQAWGVLEAQQSFDEHLPVERERREGWRKRLAGRQLELGWLARDGRRRARFERLTAEQLGL
jgi:hypothetical protein